MTDSPFADVDDGAQIDQTVEPTSRSSDPTGRLFDGNAIGPSVEEIKHDYGLPWHWSTCLRGCCRVMSGDGVPPVFEIAMGGALGAAEQFRGNGIDAEPEPSNEPESEAPRPWSE